MHIAYAWRDTSDICTQRDISTPTGGGLRDAAAPRRFLAFARLAQHGGRLAAACCVLSPRVSPDVGLVFKRSHSSSSSILCSSIRASSALVP